LPEAYDRARIGTEIRPILAWDTPYALFAFNPNLSTPLAGPDYRAGPVFEPALVAKGKLFDTLMLGVEYYASLGPIASPARLSDQEHYLYEAIDWIGFENLDMNLAVGEGLTGASNAWTVKMIVGYEFEDIARGPRKGR
jgi:hypothetical protein